MVMEKLSMACKHYVCFFQNRGQVTKNLSAQTLDCVLRGHGFCACVYDAWITVSMS